MVHYFRIMALTTEGGGKAARRRGGEVAGRRGGEAARLRGREVACFAALFRDFRFASVLVAALQPRRLAVLQPRRVVVLPPRSLAASPPCSVSVLSACGRPQNSTSPGSMPVPQTSTTFGTDVAFLRAHTDVLTLASADGKAQVAIAPKYQGRVMTSTADGADGELRLPPSSCD